MNLTRQSILSVCGVLLFACGGGDSGGGSADPAPRATAAEVGKLLFEDARLSANGDQSCASCHAASSGFADPDSTNLNPVSEGSIPGSFGNRNAPTSAYAGFSPKFDKTTDAAGNPVYVGGLFMDGRSSSLETQAMEPFLNMLEMANTSKLAVVEKVQSSTYVDKFKAVFGADVFDNTDIAYDDIAFAIAAFERTDEMNKFNSKFDCYLQDKEAYPLSDIEQKGLERFDFASKCSICHSVEPDPVSGKVLLTNFQYFNIGVPKNPNNPFKDIDNGLGKRMSLDSENGKFRTPTLRNIELTAPYMHNGVFSTLEEVIRFYYILEKETAEPPPEVSTNIAADATPSDDLTDDHITELLAFMKTLTDGTGVGICF